MWQRIWRMKVYEKFTSCQNYDHFILSTEKKEEEEETWRNKGWHDHAKTMLLYAVGVFFAILVFQFSIVLSLVIAILLLMVDIEVYGLLYLLGAKLNGKTEQISSHSFHFRLNYAHHLLFLLPYLLGFPIVFSIIAR